MLVLLAGIVAIVVWQMGFTRDGADAKDVKIDETYKVTAASGMHNDAYFVYFYWYTGLFPVASTLAYEPCFYRCPPKEESMAPAALSREAAEGLMRQRPETLVMDSTWTWYEGDRGKIFLYLLDAWLKGAPDHPSVKPMHRSMFIGALCALFFAFWWTRRPALGALCVLFLGSNPFQLYEVHRNENVFGWSITAAILLLAIHLPLLTSRRAHTRWVFALPIVTGFFMATVRTARSEPMPLLVAALFAYAFVRFSGASSRRDTWLRRGALALTLVVTFFVGHTLWTRYFVKKNDEASEVLARIGGHPYPGGLRMYHRVWHPIWCGLGDFDTTHGYEWSDTRAAAYAKPILEQRFHRFVPMVAFEGVPRTLDEYWDESGFYKKFPYEIPEYEQVVREKVVSDILADPGWYVGILAKRVWRVLMDATPIRISIHKGWLNVPILSAKLYVPLLVACLAARARFASMLLAFTLPTLTTALVVHCDRGLPWYGIMHLTMAAVIVMVCVEAARLGYRRYVKGAVKARTS